MVTYSRRSPGARLACGRRVMRTSATLLIVACHSDLGNDTTYALTLVPLPSCCGSNVAKEIPAELCACYNPSEPGGSAYEICGETPPKSQQQRQQPCVCTFPPECTIVTGDASGCAD